MNKSKSLSAREVIQATCQSLSHELKGQKIDINVVSEVSRCWEGVGYMRYHVAYILPGTKSYWSLCLGEHDNSLFTRQYDCDLTIVKVIGLNHKMFIVNAVERGKWFSNSLVHATKDGKLHTNKDNYPKEHLSILETKMKEGLILQGLVARYKADFPEVLHQAIKALVMS